MNSDMASDNSSSDEGTAAASPFVGTVPDAGCSEDHGKGLGERSSWYSNTIQILRSSDMPVV